jgi:hypothetical protein
VRRGEGRESEGGTREGGDFPPFLHHLVSFLGRETNCFWIKIGVWPAIDQPGVWIPPGGALPDKSDYGRSLGNLAPGSLSCSAL